MGVWSSPIIACWGGNVWGDQRFTGAWCKWSGFGAIAPSAILPRHPGTSCVLILFLSSGTAGVTNATVGLGTVRLWFEKKQIFYAVIASDVPCFQDWHVDFSYSCGQGALGPDYLVIAWLKNVRFGRKAPLPIFRIVRITTWGFS